MGGFMVILQRSITLSLIGIFITFVVMFVKYALSAVQFVQSPALASPVEFEYYFGLLAVGFTVLLFATVATLIISVIYWSKNSRTFPAYSKKPFDRLCRNINCSTVVALLLLVPSLMVARRIFFTPSSPRIVIAMGSVESPLWLVEVAALPVAIQQYCEYNRPTVSVKSLDKTTFERDIAGASVLIIGAHGRKGMVRTISKEPLNPHLLHSQTTLEYVHIGACDAAAEREQWQRVFPNAAVFARSGDYPALEGLCFLCVGIFRVCH